MSSNKPQTTTTAQQLDDIAKAVRQGGGASLPVGPAMAAGFWLAAGDPQAAAWSLEGDQGGQGK